MPTVASLGSKIAAARFLQALEMYELGIEIMRQNLRRRFPDDTEAQHEGRLLRWLHERPDETEWPHGRPVSWPRTGR